MKNRTFPPVVVKFISLLFLIWPKDRKQNLITMITGLLILDGTRSVSRIYREISMKKEPSSLIKFISQSPWSYDDLLASLQSFIIREALKNVSYGETIPVFFSIDDRLISKHKDSKDLAGFTWLFDHVEGQNAWGRTFVTSHININGYSFFFGYHPYYPKKVRRSIRKKNLSVRFASKPTIAGWMIDSLKELLDTRPDLSFSVIVLFDCAFAATRILRKIKRYRYHFICGIKKNRKLDNIQVQLHAQRLTRQDFHIEKVATGNGKIQTYRLTSISGRLKGFRPRVRVLLSKQSPRSSCRYYATDLTALMDKSMLLLMMRRWEVEVDHLYLSQHCGMDDFECRSDEAILKYLSLCSTSLIFVQWMNQKQKRKENLAETIRRFRKSFFSRKLRLALRMVQQNYKWNSIIQRLNAQAA